MKFPSMARIKQTMEGPTLADVPWAAGEAIRTLDLRGRVRAGQTVAVTAGSRGIANLDRIIRAVVDELKTLGLQPFIVPAMGSHGGATAEGQIAVLARYGITPESMGVPVRSSMETVEIARMDWGLPVLVDKYASEADHIVLVNRVKPHTGYRGPIESGLLKILVIGLGKHRGAELAHRAAIDVGLARMVPEVARVSLARLPVLFGLAILENALHQTARLEAILPENLESTEAHLLKEARGLMARIPFDFAHLLIVDEIGKEISGAGMDPNVIGRMAREVALDPGAPKYVRILVRDVTVKSGGNAVGMGLADFGTRRLADKVNFHATYTNMLTASATLGAKLPIIFETDREAIEGALKTIGLTPPEQARVVRIKNTLDLAEMDVSEGMLPEVQTNPRLSQITQPAPVEFDPEGNLSAFWGVTL